MQITPIPAFGDNYIWLIQTTQGNICIDPGDATPVIEFLQQQRQNLHQIWITHHHDDHRGGVAALKLAFPQVEVYGNSDIPEADCPIRDGMQLTFGQLAAEVWLTPGHTAHHICYLLAHQNRLHVFCGDTLFSAGCGRVFTGTIQQLFDSFQRFKQLPDDTLFYPAHEYTAANLRFAAHIEPDNPDIQAALSGATHTPTLPVTLEHERRINPFLRTHLPHIRQRVETLSGIELGDELSVFAALRTLKNSF
ncbi:hydroxyacylglutathione hydrolase [Neisseria lisongii]|uniref:Hydroxyacylglutathione hydrolase n=1 Tax=Neisseria lisongii TaxID=2912188 RepID=A0AAW5APF7_9NEIS|nr:hydroxyacylglutathione hydrolase [Neisseria lisongii]MCF7528910.1 hydroxyacylglutathione hydrolase [Neisseria lisongii]